MTNFPKLHVSLLPHPVFTFVFLTVLALNMLNASTCMHADLSLVTLHMYANMQVDLSLKVT